MFPASTVRPSDPLYGCFIKLQRAREHLTALTEASDRYFTRTTRGSPIRVRGGYDRVEGRYAFVAEVTEEPPLRIGVIVGDVVHQLRSSLDHLTWQLVAAAVGDPDQRGRPLPEFPVVLEGEHWPKKYATKGGILRDVNDRAVLRLMKAQPFYTHGHLAAKAPLTRLNTMWNSDKHRTVHLTNAAVGTSSGLTYVRRPVKDWGQRLRIVRDVGAIHEVWAYEGIPLHGGTVLDAMITPSGPTPEIELIHHPIQSGLVLPDGAPVNHALAEMAASVEFLLRDFHRNWPNGSDEVDAVPAVVRF